MPNLRGSPDLPPLFPASAPDADTGGKEGARHRKREEKLRRDAERRPTSMERWKILIDAIGEARHVIDLADHRALRRLYAALTALVVMAGALLGLWATFLARG